MANIPVRKKRGTPWIWWLLGLLLFIAVIWILVATLFRGDPDVAETDRITPETTQTPSADAEEVRIGDILNDPADYVGQPFPGAQVSVVEVPTDRGFWIEDEGERLFAIIIDEPREVPKDINPGQTLRIEGGTLRDSSFLAEMPGVPLDQGTKDIVDEQAIFLVVDEENIEILESTAAAGAEAAEPPTAQPGVQTGEPRQ